MEALLGGIVGVIFAVIFQPPLERVRTALIARVRRLWYSARRRNEQPRAETFSLAGRSLPFLVVDGDGDMAYRPHTLTCVLDPQPIEFPASVQALREAIARREADKSHADVPHLWNGPQVGLKRYVIGRTVPDEEMELRLVLHRSDYYTFQATVLSLDTALPDGSTLRNRHLSPPAAEPVPFLAIGLGVALVLITRDEKFVLCCRSTNSGARANELDVSVVEGVHLDHDRSTHHAGPDLYKTAVRGAKEELGIELPREDICFLGFGVDLDYYQWNVIGFARLAVTSEELMVNRTRGSSGKWENRDIQFVDTNPDAVWIFLRNRRLWATAWVALYWAMVREYGRRKVEKSASENIGYAPILTSRQ